MKIHDLQFRGIGPFPDEQHIDFDALGQAGMFLLEGPTGVGKSTIIDAIVFALYGGVASQEADDARLVSDFRAPEQQPYVQLVFSTARGTYRVRRSPAHWRPKAKARGAADLTHQNSTATLMKIAHPSDPDGTPLGSRPGEVGPAIHEAVGLDKEQFVSTIVLPQGQFATFLRAGSKDRQPVLQKIFRTHQYEKLQQRLREAGRAAEAKRKSAQDAVATALDTFRGAVSSMGDDALDGVSAESSRDALETALSSAVVGYAARRDTSAAARDEAANRHAEAAAELAAVEARIRRRDERAAALQRRAALSSHEAAIQVRRDLLADHERAARVVDAVAAAAHAQSEQAAAQQCLDQVLATAPADLAGLPIPALEEYAKESRRTVGALSNAVADEQALPGKQTRAAGLEDTARQLGLAEQGLLAQLNALPGQIASCRSRLAEQQAKAQRAGGLQSDLATVEHRARAAEQLVTAQTKAQALADDFERLVSALTDADGEVAAATTRYRAGIAATIGAALVPQQPCPACGSTDHPDPARPTDDHVTVDDVDAATARATKARDLVEQARQARNAQDLLITEMSAIAAGLTVVGAQARLAELESELAGSVRAAADAIDTAERILELESQTSSLAEALEATRHQLTAATTTAAGVRDEIVESQQRIDAARQDFPNVTARVADLESRVAMCDTLVVCRQRVATSECAARSAGDYLAQALQREGFADSAAAVTARLTDTVREEALAAITDHEQETVRVEAILDRDDLVGVDPNESIDRWPYAAAATAAQATFTDRQREFNEVSQVLRQAELLAGGITGSVDLREAEFAATETALQLARLADGKNVLGIDLATFVLVHRFRSVLEAANLHLTQMSNGRLVLESFEEAEKKSAKAGLGIRVRDLHTETTRTPKTLSGGETFYVSLSLALGLAEIVAAESGGVELDTLFVDEGFGSLDPETLDTVMGVLDGLQANGRVLGLVSHVAEMKERIAERVEVRRIKEAGPSTLRVVA